MLLVPLHTLGQAPLNPHIAGNMLIGYAFEMTKSFLIFSIANLG
jgi:hypothetical protein